MMAFKPRASSCGAGPGEEILIYRRRRILDLKQVGAKDAGSYIGGEWPLL
jgi:hypothetical protein